MKLDNLISNSPVPVHLRAIEGMAGYEAGQPLKDGEEDVVILLHYAGVNSDRFQNERARQKKAEDSGQVVNAETKRKNTARLYASAIVGWQGIDPPYSIEAAQAMLEPVESAWIVAQLDKALGDIAKKLQSS